MYKHMAKVVIKFSQVSAVARTVLGGLTISSGCKYSIMYMYQKLLKKIGRQ